MLLFRCKVKLNYVKEGLYEIYENDIIQFYLLRSKKYVLRIEPVS